ncbi:MAG: hypothetical protein JWQ35_1379 [Bacteriovoracaceae bacterium]|nr:hypothetical protein [Bacteriovoracaceae bacterium]
MTFLTFLFFACLTSVSADDLSGDRFNCLPILAELNRLSLLYSKNGQVSPSVQKFVDARVKDIREFNFLSNADLYAQIESFRHNFKSENDFEKNVLKLLSIAPLLFFSDGRFRYGLSVGKVDIVRRLSNITTKELILRYSDFLTKSWNEQIEAIASRSGYEKILILDLMIQKQIYENGLLHALRIKDDRSTDDLIHQFGSRKEALRNVLSHLNEQPDYWSAIALQLLGVQYATIQNFLNHLPLEVERAFKDHHGGIFVADSPIEAVKNAATLIHPKPGEVLIDVGSGTGTSGNIFAVLHPQLLVKGYELVKEKVDEANRVRSELGIFNAEYKEQNLDDPNFHIPVADYYYFYNPVSGGVFNKIFRDLKEIGRKKRIHIIVYYGPFDAFEKSKEFRRTPQSSHGNGYEIRMYESASY